MPLCSPNSVVSSFQYETCQIFRQLPNWLSHYQLSDAEKLQAYGDPGIRQKLRLDLEAPVTSDSRFVNRWDLVLVAGAVIYRANQGLQGKKAIAETRRRGKEKIRLMFFLISAVEEESEHCFCIWA